MANTKQISGPKTFPGLSRNRPQETEGLDPPPPHLEDWNVVIIIKGSPPFRILIYRTWAIKWKRHFHCLLTWLRGFLVILGWCSLCSNLFWELRDNWVEKKNCNFDPKASESCQNFNISKVGCGHTRSMCSTVFIARPPFPSLPLSYPTHFNEADEEKLSPWENSTVVVSTNYFKLPLPCFYF